jgi:peroxiredoxin
MELTKIKVNDQAPEFGLRSIDGKMVSHWDFKEKQNIILVFFNHSNNKDLEMLERLQSKDYDLADMETEILAVGRGSEEVLLKMLEEIVVTFPILMDVASKTHKAYGVENNAIFVIDRFGKVKYANYNFTDSAEILEKIINSIEMTELETGTPIW